MLKHCPFCNQLLDTHPTCDACGILCCGNDYYMPITKFRNHNICSACKKHWTGLEDEYGYGLSFNQFVGKEGRGIGSNTYSHRGMYP